MRPEEFFLRGSIVEVTTDPSAWQLDTLNREVLVFPAVRFSSEEFAARLETFPCTGSSNRIARHAVLDEPPSLDAGEMTDKGTINQKAVVRRRAHIVESLFAESSSGEK